MNPIPAPHQDADRAEQDNASALLARRKAVFSPAGSALLDLACETAKVVRVRQWPARHGTPASRAIWSFRHADGLENV